MRDDAYVSQICKKYNLDVIHHAHPPFLGKQDKDIFIPALKIGIEYQGRQHYEPIEFFGGVDGFNHRKDLDERKKKLCKKHEITLIEFRYDEPLDKEYIWNILQEHIENMHPIN